MMRLQTETNVSSIQITRRKDSLYVVLPDGKAVTVNGDGSLITHADGKIKRLAI